MTRIALVLGSMVLGAGLRAADDPPAKKELTPGEQEELAAELRRHDAAGDKAYAAGRYAEALEAWGRALQVARRLHTGRDHSDVAASLNNLGLGLRLLGKNAEAEARLREAQAINERLYPGDHPAVATGHGNLGGVYRAQGRFSDAEAAFRSALDMWRRLRPGRDDPGLAQGMNNLAVVLKDRSKYAEAEALYRDALAMRRRMITGDAPAVAMSLNNLAGVLVAQGRYAEAEALYRSALEMRRRIHHGDHPDLALAFNNLAAVLDAQRRWVDAEPLFRDALEMRRRVYGNNHPDVAAGLNNLASVLHSRKRYADAEPLYRAGLELNRRLLGPGHPAVATGLNNLASVLEARGDYAAALPLYQSALAARRKLHQVDHPDVAASLSNLAGVQWARGEYAAAEPLFRDAVRMYRALAEEYAATRSEGAALTLAATFPTTRAALLSNAREARSRADAVYADVWASRAATTRLFEVRGLRVRAASAVPEAVSLVDQLADARQRRAELILAPEPIDPTTARKRIENLEELTDRIGRLNVRLRPLLPAVARADRVAGATLAALQRVLPTDATVIDVLAYTLWEQNPQSPGDAGRTETLSYTAFVVTRDKVAWVDLGPAKPVEEAVGLWRRAITGSKEVPADLPARVRKLVWDPVRAALPAGTKTVYVVPDTALTGLPWAAIPGDKPNTILLDDFAVATLPHAPYLLDKLWPQDPRPNPPAGLLAVGGVGFADDPARPGLWAALRSAGPRARDAAVKDGAKLEWKALPGTAAEANGLASLAAGRKIDARLLTGDRATTDAVLAALPTARYAHIATHGFFADPSFRSVLQLDPKLFEVRGGERVGAGANSPMVMSGLVFAGANKPGTPGRGIVTGEALVDRDLSGMDLAVLSACETGLGEVAGGEGVFGLTRAFHVAGCRDVVASLWKVDDDATAALMSLFYRNLWEKNLAPIEALRRAQLHVYRNPAAIPDLAKGLRGQFEVVKGSAPAEVAPTAGPDGKAHPRLWAAFVLSGPGR